MTTSFELLHPRAAKGTKGAGHFIDVVGRMSELGGSWDDNKGVWVVPKDKQPQLEALVTDMGVPVVYSPKGMHPATDDERRRYVVPPAWTDVFVADDDSAETLVVGKDSKGRRQSKMSAEHDARSAKEKFARVRGMSDSLPVLDRALRRDAPENDTAAALMLIRKTGLRVGSDRDTGADKNAHGASNLLRSHVQIDGDNVRLRFVGKDGVDIDLEVNDSELAHMLQPRLLGPPNERIFDTNDAKIRRYMTGVLPGYKVKDLRTHVGTAEALRMVNGMDIPTTRAQAKKQRRLVAEHVSSVLGNTPTIALNSYIDPTVFKDWKDVL